MNPFKRYVSAAVALTIALFVSGCVSSSSSRALRPKVTMEFAIVESSTEKELTPAQVADLRQAVADYLREQGLSDGRTYYVKVTFPSTNPDEEPQWAIVRIGSQGERTYTVIAAYPGRDDYYPYDFYRTNYSFSNYYPGYSGFSRWGYYDPFDYNYGYYNPPLPPRDHKPDRPNKPDDRKPDHSPGDHTRWNHAPRTDDRESPDRPRVDHPTRPTNVERWTRERPDGRDTPNRPNTPRPERTERSHTPTERPSTLPERSHTPLPERSYSPPSPPPERSYSPPADTSSIRTEPMSNGSQTSREKER